MLLFVLFAFGLSLSKSQYKTWTAKYGYGRFFPVYVDKSGFADDSPAPKAVSNATQRKIKRHEHSLGAQSQPPCKTN